MVNRKTTGVLVGVGVRVEVAVAVGVLVGVAVGVLVGVGGGVMVAVGVAVAVGVGRDHERAAHGPVRLCYGVAKAVSDGEVCCCEHLYSTNRHVAGTEQTHHRLSASWRHRRKLWTGSIDDVGRGRCVRIGGNRLD